MTTTNLTKMTESEFKSKVAKQKDRQSTLMSLTAGECVVETEGTGKNKKAVIYGVPYTDRKGQPQTYPAVAVGENAVALTALMGKDSLTQSDGTVVPRTGLCEVGSTYAEILEALEKNDFKFNLEFVTARSASGFYGRYGIVTK